MTANYCSKTGRFYYEPEKDHDNFGVPICPFCGKRHEDETHLDEDELIEMLEQFSMKRRWVKNEKGYGHYEYELTKVE